MVSGGSVTRLLAALLIAFAILSLGACAGSAPQSVDTTIPTSVTASVLPTEDTTAPVPITTAEGTTVNLVFIHHSVGENWLNDGLCRALNDSGYHVADIYYGWRAYGDNTDTVDWPTWFTD